MIGSVDKAMKILSVISDREEKSISLSEIAEKCDMPKPTCFHILKTLAIDGYVERTTRPHGYRLGPMLYYLTRHGRYGESLITLARPVMRWIERRTGLTVVLSVIKSGKKFIIENADSEQRLFNEEANMRIDDIYRTATGRIILAYMNDEELYEVYSRLGNPDPKDFEGISSLDSLKGELEKIREAGFAVSLPSESEHQKRDIGYARPLFKGGKCIGAVGIARRLKDSAEVKISDTVILKILKKGADEIQRRLTFEE